MPQLDFKARQMSIDFRLTSIEKFHQLENILFPNNHEKRKEENDEDIKLNTQCEYFCKKFCNRL